MNGSRPMRGSARGYAPQRRPRRTPTAPVRPHDQHPRGTRPHATGLSRDHTHLQRPAGVGCRHTQGLDEVWSARHAPVPPAEQGWETPPFAYGPQDVQASFGRPSAPMMDVSGAALTDGVREVRPLARLTRPKPPAAAALVTALGDLLARRRPAARRAETDRAETDRASGARRAGLMVGAALTAVAALVVYGVAVTGVAGQGATYGVLLAAVLALLALLRPMRAELARRLGARPAATPAPPAPAGRPERTDRFDRPDPGAPRESAGDDARRPCLEERTAFAGGEGDPQG